MSKLQFLGLLDGDGDGTESPVSQIDSISDFKTAAYAIALNEVKSVERDGFETKEVASSAFDVFVKILPMMKLGLNGSKSDSDS